jgi:calcineurin-like phosphoesterase family protein
MITKPLKIRRKDYRNIYWCADQHIGHARDFVYSARGFGNIQDHDEWILNQLYSLTADDLLINLGDFTLMSSVEKTQEILHNIKAKHLYAANGNHESFMSKIYFKHLDKFWKGFDLEELSPEDDLTNRRISLYPLNVPTDPKSQEMPNLENPTDKNSNCKLTFFGESTTLSIDDNTFYMRHMATAIWDRMTKDVMHVHGHSHGGYHGSQPDDLNDGRRLDVGVDNAIKYNGTCFFKYEEVLEIMKKKNVKQIDHH